MKSELINDLLSRALYEEMGLVITTNNPHGLSQKLHAEAKTDERFSSLMITVPSTPETVIITKRSVELNENVF